MFITFEGGEGSGKTTLIKKLAETLRLNGYDVITTREPGGSKISEAIREILLDKNNHSLTKETEALLFAAARAQHLDEIILPALKEGKIVLCDRYLDSSISYQAFARDLGVDFVRKINTYAVSHMPALTFYLALNPEEGEKRVKNGRSHKIDRLDLESKSFHEKVQEGYEYIYRSEPNRVKKIDASRDVDTIYTEVYQLIINAL